MLTIFTYAQQALTILIALVMLVERKGDGAAKKAEVIDGLQLALAALPIPTWIKAIFAIDAVVGTLIDITVSLLNKTGWFTTTADPAPVN